MVHQVLGILSGGMEVLREPLMNQQEREDILQVDHRLLISLREQLLLKVGDVVELVIIGLLHEVGLK